MTAKEKLHDILDNGTDKQIEVLISLLMLERRAGSDQDDHQEDGQ